MHVDRYTTPAGDRRYQPVMCKRCIRFDPVTREPIGTLTPAMDAVCDRCHAKECEHPTNEDGIPLCWLAKEATDA